MMIKSAERLVDILETWGSNLVRQIDYAGHGEYVLSGHSNSRNSSKAETALLNKPLDLYCSYSLLAYDIARLNDQKKVRISEIYAVSVFRVECYAKS